MKILPSLYNDLASYTVELTTCSAILPSLKTYFLDSFDPKTSPYGVEVCKSISCYLSTCDKDLLNLYMKQVCNQNAVILKRQRGNQYGFDDEVDSPQHVTKNMSEAMLDDPAANYTHKVG